MWANSASHHLPSLVLCTRRRTCVRLFLRSERSCPSTCPTSLSRARPKAIASSSTDVRLTLNPNPNPNPNVRTYVHPGAQHDCKIDYHYHPLPPTAVDTHHPLHAYLCHHSWHTPLSPPLHSHFFCHCGARMQTETPLCSPRK